MNKFACSVAENGHAKTITESFDSLDVNKKKQNTLWKRERFLATQEKEVIDKVTISDNY